jgi:FKBP-type peptidyl-prolyl cis-trans isomerase
MKILITLSVSLLFAVFAIAAPQSSSIIHDVTDATNYSFGFDLGEKMRQQQIQFRADALSDGIYDALAQKPPRINEELMTQLLEQAAGNQVPTTTAPKAFRLPGQKYISENSSSDGVVTLPSGLQYKIIKTGDGQTTPRKNDKVLVNYRMKTINGKVFSSTYPLGIPTPEILPANQGIAGWTEALSLMHEGDEWEVTIPTRLAYRDSGPMAGQTVIVDLQLLEIIPGGP